MYHPANIAERPRHRKVANVNYASRLHAFKLRFNYVLLCLVRVRLAAVPFLQKRRCHRKGVVIITDWRQNSICLNYEAKSVISHLNPLLHRERYPYCHREKGEIKYAARRVCFVVNYAREKVSKFEQENVAK